MSAPFVYPLPVVFDEAGEPLMGAKLWFYEINTSTPKNTYTDAALGEAHANPVVADAFGIFPAIWLDESGTDYRMVLTDQFDVTKATVDGLLSQTTPSDLLNSIITVDGAGSGLDADLLDGLDSTAFAQKAEAETIAGEWNFTTTPLIKGEKAGFLGIPAFTATASYELRLNDNGKTIASTAGGLVIPVTSDFPFQIGAFAVGHCTCFYNDSASNQQITAETPATTTIRLAGTVTTGTRTVAPRGLAVVYQVKLDEWLVYGTGVS